MRSLTHTRPDEIQKWIDRGWLKSRSLTAAGTKAKIIDADDFCQRHPVPIMLLARLAVDHGWHGQGVGKALLKDAMLRTLQAGRHCQHTSVCGPCEGR